MAGIPADERPRAQFREPPWLGPAGTLVRSIFAIGAGLAVAFFLFMVVFNLTFIECPYLQAAGPCAKVPLGGRSALPGIVATLLAGDMLGYDTTWSEVRFVLGWAGAMVVAGFVVALIAPRWRLGHAAIVGSLFAGVLFVRHDGGLSLAGAAHSLLWAIPAALGGALAWALASRAWPRRPITS